MNKSLEKVGKAMKKTASTVSQMSQPQPQTNIPPVSSTVLKEKSDNIKKVFKFILGYFTGFVFLMGIISYSYMLITDNLEKEEHSLEEKCWIYSMFILLIIGFLLSFYLIYKK